MTESAACLMRDGQVVAAAEEERFTRVKHEGGFPYRAIEFVLSVEGLQLADIDHLAVYWDPYNLGHRLRYMAQTMVRHPVTFAQKLRRAAAVMSGGAAHGQDAGWGSLFKVGKLLDDRFGTVPKRIHYLDHHQCHMASCYYATPWEEAALLVMDGAGEAACTTWGLGRGNVIETIDAHNLPHSLGHYYSAVTGYLGFKMLDGEYKLMGLSAYGEASGAPWIRDNFLRTVAPGRYHLETEVLDYHRGLQGRFDGAFADHFGPPREQHDDAPFTDVHREIASSAQRAYEDVVLDMAKILQRNTGFRRLGIAGGCGLNCLANGKIIREGVFEEIYVPPVPNDSGGALGAALLLYGQLSGKRPEPIVHAQFGPEFSDEEIGAAIAASPGVTAQRIETEDALVERAASALSGGELLAWFQGRMEYGPRALGSRSFLADPRSEDVVEHMNAKIKKREKFRPFAPSVKAERAADYFELSQPSPFMTIVVKVRPDKAAEVPAIVHADGTARPQTVDREHCPRYWALIDRFEAKTGVPMLLNTSFNIQEPIVCNPDEALATFGKSGVDALVLGNYWVTRRAEP
ncbi:MAG: carbamoyltransferase [Nannocystaceae bacterium]|nr:carbamoyltransferase [Nannocystaceae bacterium]